MCIRYLNSIGEVAGPLSLKLEAEEEKKNFRSTQVFLTVGEFHLYEKHTMLSLFGHWIV